MRFSLKKYAQPTPSKMRKLGDALLGVSTFITASAIVNDLKWVALFSVLIGAIGKFFTNFFTEETENV